MTIPQHPDQTNPPATATRRSRWIAVAVIATAVAFATLHLALR